MPSIVCYIQWEEQGIVCLLNLPGSVCCLVFMGTGSEIIMVSNSSSVTQKIWAIRQASFDFSLRVFPLKQSSLIVSMLQSYYKDQTYRFLQFVWHIFSNQSSLATVKGVHFLYIQNFFIKKLIKEKREIPKLDIFNSGDLQLPQCGFHDTLDRHGLPVSQLALESMAPCCQSPEFGFPFISGYSRSSTCATTELWNPLCDWVL